jgi:rubrerythrin
MKGTALPGLALTALGALDTSSARMGLLARLLGIEPRTHDLVADLTAAFRAEAAQAAHLRQQADRARYPQVAEAFRALAEVEDRHAAALRDRLLALGGEIPPLVPAPLRGANQWERAGAALRAAQQKRKQLVDVAVRWDPEEPEIVALLNAIEDEDRAALAVYERVVMRSDPQAID